MIRNEKGFKVWGRLKMQPAIKQVLAEYQNTINYFRIKRIKLQSAFFKKPFNN